MVPLRSVVPLGCTAALIALAACANDVATTPQAIAPAAAAVSSTGPLPTGERFVGNSSVEPAYDADLGTLLYLSTPIKSPFPTHTNSHAVSPLYLVIYPPGSGVGTLNCMGIPGNCPDHDVEVATVATQVMPAVYGTDVNAIPGHDHIVDSPGRGKDFNVAWEVVEVMFTNTAAASHHLTTEPEIDAAVARGDAIKLDLGFAFHCSIVPASLYWNGTPVGG